MLPEFWGNKRVFITGHTGFKGSWLCLWLAQMGAQVRGYALDPPTTPSLFTLANLSAVVDSQIADVRDGEKLSHTLTEFKPDIVIHMAAQPLVRDSYKIPVETYSINVMGTVHLLEAVRRCPTVKAVINVTTDKVYQNNEWPWGYRENEPLGGHDPYSNSKACSELVTAAYRTSYFNPDVCPNLAIASARAGNVIGGGDWATDRLVPDIIKSVLAGEPVHIRNPNAIRPWQHVLEPLSGYLALAQRLYESGPGVGTAWNFGPPEEDTQPVGWIVQQICEQWGNGAHYLLDTGEHPHEAHCLKLDCSKAKTELGWRPRWSLKRTIGTIIDWTRAYSEQQDMRAICLKQIADYEETP